MKVLIILATPGPMVGGMEKQVALQANYLSQIPSLQIYVIASLCYAPIFSERVIFTPVDMKKSRRNPKLLFSILKIIRKSQVDIIHAHGHKAAALLSGIRYFFGSMKPKLIATSHGIKRNNKALKKMDRVFSVSEGVQSVVNPIVSTVVHNGIEPFTPTKMSKTEFCLSLGLDESLPLIVGVGRLVKLKHFEQLMHAGKDLNANIVILGDGPEHENLKALTRKNVILAGYREDVRSILHISDLMVICSDREGFSLALIEALHSRLPVISTPVPGAQDLLPDECLIKSTNHVELARFIQHHLRDLELLNKKLSTQFDFVNNELGIERVAEYTHTLYAEALNT